MFDEDDDELPFELVETKLFEFTCKSRVEKTKLKVTAGIFKPHHLVTRMQGQERWKEMVYAGTYSVFLTRHALEQRLKNPARRKQDYEDLQKDSNAKPIELWDRKGCIAATPTQLFIVNSFKPYDDNFDARQLERWKNLAIKLSKPPTNVNPGYSRFRLRPSDALRKRKNILYCSPSETNFFHVNTKILTAVIEGNTGNFDGWPDPVVVTYAKAKNDGLKLVGRNFLDLYFIWMKASDYEEVWDGFFVGGLLHPFPAANNESDYEDIEKMLMPKERRSGYTIDRTPIDISSKTVGARHRGTHGKSPLLVMNKSATIVADKLWGKHCMTSGMGNSKVEWLHRVAYGLGGSDVFNNLVFGTWECNTNMIRVESMVKALTKKDEDGVHRTGRLTTINNTGGIIYRFTLKQTNTTATLPRWAKKYSWLCCSLTYRYEMDRHNSPLGTAFAAEIELDPWSLYMPLSMEPRLDSMILDYLMSRGAIANVVAQDLENLSLTSKMGDSDSLENLPLPDYDSDAYSTLAWNAALNELPSLELPDIVVKCPTIARGPLPDGIVAHSPILTTTPVPQSGFVLQGEVNLFGTDVVGKLEKWMGPAPEDVVVGINPPSIERVVVPGDFHMSMLIPLLRDTPFDKIIFRNVSIYHQNYPFDKTKSVGWHFNADWVIDSSCGLLHDVLTKALQVDKPILSLHAELGEGLRWNGPLNLHSFILEGVFSKLALSPVSGLTLTSIGVRLLGIRGFSFAPEPHSTLSFGFGIFGMMKLDVPGSVLPLNLDYEMGLVGTMVNFRAEISGSIWRNALGVKGLMLDDVVFGTTFSTTSLWDSFAFDVSATFSYKGLRAYLQGTYAAGGHFCLTAELDNFGVDEINDMFSEVFSDSLTLPDYDIHVGSAILSIISGQGLSLSLLDVDIAGHTAASLDVTFSSSGASLSGKLSRSVVTFGDVQLRDALIKLSFWTTGQKRNVDLTLGGTLVVDFIDLAITAIVHLYPCDDGVEWAVVAELNAPNRPFSLSDVVPAVKDSFVDFSLSNAVFIVASQDDPSIGQSYPGYHVRKGVHVFGVIERIPALNDLLHADVKGIILDAGWFKDSGFDLFISLPAEASINLGNGIKTTPITLSIKTDPPELAVTAGVTVPVQDSTPLDFSFILAANAIGASASAQMQGWWVKPFGIDSLKIGPEVTLSIEIVYAQFATTGTPSGFGVSGGLMIGSTEASIAMNVSEDPKRQLLYGQVKKLGISDVVMFASTIVQQEIPNIPNGLLKFEELSVYICPFGVTLGKTTYPQGFSFKADLLLFDKRANIECTIDKAERSVDIIGGVDNFELGPLSIRGSNGPRATLECHVGVSKQQLIVDGVVSLFDIQSQTYLNLQFLPEPIFKFHLLLQFAHIFMFKLDAELLGSIQNRLSDADFSVHAEMENDILGYITQQIVEQFEAAKVAATQGLQAARQKVDEAQKDWEDAIAAEEKKVEEAQKKWEEHDHSVRSDSQPIIDHYLSKITQLQGKVESARKVYNNAFEGAQKAMSKANQDRGAALATAQRAVNEAERKMNDTIDDAQRKLDGAEAALSIAFGDAQRDIDHAQQEVWSLQNKIDDLKKIIYEYNDAPWYQFWKKVAIAGLWIAVGTLEASRAVASAALDVARGILMGSEFLTKDVAVGTARGVLEGARATGTTVLAAAQVTLRAADETSKFVVDAAEAALKGIQEGVEFVAFQTAIEALKLFKTINQLVYEAAVAAIDGLVDCGAFIAFNVAKAALAVARGSTKVLDAVKGALWLAEKATQAALTILQEIIKFGAKAINIKAIILDGTLRGILGIGGENARPFSAVIKGYVLGQWFDIRIEFDLRAPVTFITAIFKRLWDMVCDFFTPGTATALTDEQLDLLKSETVDDTSDRMDPGVFLAAKSKFLQQRPDVLRTLIDKSEEIPMNMPRLPFSGKHIVSSEVVARKALMLMHEAKGISVLHDLNTIM